MGIHRISANTSFILGYYLENKRMKYEAYENICVAKNYSLFEFFSIGSNGMIKKRISFEKL